MINLCFGGPKGNILYMCAPRTVLRVPCARARPVCLQDGWPVMTADIIELDARRRPASSAGEIA